MNSAAADACAKLTLCGEHAIMFGRPAIAIPVPSVRAYVTVEQCTFGKGILFDARNLGLQWEFIHEPKNPLSILVSGALEHLKIETLPDLLITINSDIPIASGMGSSSSVATAIVRALAAYLGHNLSLATISALVYQSDNIYHGTASGIDNTVIAFEHPIWFIRQTTNDEQSRATDPLGHINPFVNTTVSHYQRCMYNALIEPVTIAVPFNIVIGDTGVRVETKKPINEIRRRRQENQAKYDLLFDAISLLVAKVSETLASGNIKTLGILLNENQTLLEQIGVSSPEIDTLVTAARKAGALGAKLSGAGWGGVMFALVTPETQVKVVAALIAAGARHVLEIEIGRYN